MKKNKSQQLRASLAEEAARLMYEEGVKQYHSAKFLAAKRLLGRSMGKKVRYRPKDLPSNGEIQASLKHLVELNEDPDQHYRLFAMRVIALEVMHDLLMFYPCLIGSVSTGHIREGSDIDLHVFTDDLELLLTRLDTQEWRYSKAEVSIQKNGKIMLYTHIYLESVFPIELSVYPTLERRVVSRSSTDGKPIKRLKHGAVEKLLEQEHGADWMEYLSDGVLKGYRA